MNKSLLILCSFPLFLLAQKRSFIEVSDKVGMDYRYPGNDFQMAGGGVTIIDFNKDGWEDVFQAGGVFPSKLWMNQEGRFVDFTDKLNLNSLSGYFIQGTVAADLNNDGFEDLIVANYGSGMSRGDHYFPVILINKKGKSFEIKSLENILPLGNYSSVVVSDLNQDGLTDIFYTNYVAQMGALYDSIGNTVGYNPSCYPNKLLLNKGNFTFQEVSKEWGLDDSGCGLAATFTDLNKDSYPDLLLLNDFGEWTKLGNKCYLNNFPNPEFTDVSASVHFTSEMYGMGVGKTDLNKDGTFEYYLTNIGKNQFLSFENNQFLDFADSLNLSEYKSTDKKMSTSWTPVFFDFDFDGDEDLYLTKGNVATLVPPAKIKDPNKFYLNENGRFLDYSDSVALNDVLSHRGAVFTDFDHDGDLDLISSIVKLPWAAFQGLDQKIKVYENQSSIGNWIGILLIGQKEINADAFGVIVKLYTKDGKILTKEVDGGSGQASQSSKILYFGIGKESSFEKVEVIISKDKVLTINALEINTVNKVWIYKHGNPTKKKKRKA